MREVTWMVGFCLVAACGPQAVAPGRRAGAGATRSPDDHTGEPMRAQGCADAGGEVQAVDVNNDGRPDVRTVSRGGRLYCREMDANFDGRVDSTRFFDESGAVVRIEDDYDFDGRIDVIGTYVGGTLASDLLDLNFDGLVDTFRTYRGGHLATLRRDVNADGQIDLWEEYDDNGAVSHSAVDANHDGRPDDPAPAAPVSNVTNDTASGGSTPGGGLTATPIASAAADGGSL